MIRRPPRSTHCISSAASDVYKRQEVFLCDRKEPSHAKCPPHTNAAGSSSKLVFPGSNGEHWDSDRRLALLHKALWHRPAFRLRRAIALEKRPFADDTSFVEAQSTGKCAFVYMRHGDKLYDRWVRTHKTRSFVVDFHRYACLLYTSPSPRDQRGSRMPSSA